MKEEIGGSGEIWGGVKVRKRVEMGGSRGCNVLLIASGVT